MPRWGVVVFKGSAPAAGCGRRRSARWSLAVERQGKDDELRFHWFAQQYYTKLAAEFGDTVRSAWVTPPTANADPEQVGRDYRMYLRLMQGADRRGWDSLLLNEHHQTPHAMTPSPNLIAAVLATTTESAAIGSAATRWRSTPHQRIAEELA